MAAPSSPHHHHQSSLDRVNINFSTEPPLDPDVRSKARSNFYRISDYFNTDRDARDVGESGGVGVGAGNVNVNVNVSGGSPYNRALLVRLTYDYARSPASQDNFLRAFFRAVELSMDGDEDVYSHLDERISSSFSAFADFLFDNFFLPIKASTRKTPQPSPAFHSAIQRIQEGGEFAGTPARLSALRGACLVRDRHRCVVTRSFDRREGLKRYKKDGVEARDDDGNLLEQDPVQPQPLETAHIIPHSLMRLRDGSELDPSKQAALAILNMFDDGVGRLIEGTDLDRPRNALTLASHVHELFGNFDIFFEPMPESEPHTYRIGSFLQPFFVRDILPDRRTLYLTESGTIDPPSPRLLAIHCAIAHILHLSAAGGYIDEILRDMEDSMGQGIQGDGSTELGRLVHLGLWLSGSIDAC